MLKPVLRLMTGKKAIIPLGRNYKLLYDLPEQHWKSILRRPRKFLLSHTRYSETTAELVRNARYRIILLVRDPRDQVVSHARYIAEKRNRLYSFTKDQTIEQIITELIAGGPHNYQEHDMSLPIHNIKELYECRLDWLRYEHTLLVRFEDLVGPKGGGSAEKQLEGLYEIASFLDIKISEKRLTYIQKRMYGGSTTYRKGSKIGRWKEYFTPEHKALFKEVAGDLLIGLGYEQDYSW